MPSDPSQAPIFILGVPRSGTTLLRTLLDSHPNIACGPETPWLGAHQPRSVMELWRFLRQERHGYAKSFGMPPATATAAARGFVSHLMDEYARAKGKRRWAEKTPDNVLYIDFLAELFPEAKWIHLTRDGLDVAASTSIVAPQRKGISEFHEKHLYMTPVVAPVANSPFTAALRWSHWNRIIERGLSGREHLRVGYERLVTEPEPMLRELMAFLAEPFDPAMLDYARKPHDYPDWEWGSADVKAAAGIGRDRVGRGRRELGEPASGILTPIASTGRAEPPAPVATLASVAELESDRFRLFMDWLNGFAGPLGLRTFTNWSKIWEYPWLWFHALERLARPGTHLVDLGSELSPMPWVCALLGAKVTLVETHPGAVPLWTSLRDGLRVDVNWKIADSERIPLPDSSADLLTSFSVIEHQPDKPAAIREAVRILKPDGTLALSFDICEPSMGMAFPEWNGRALSLREFEDVIWQNAAFGSQPRPAWNLADIPAFLAWHRQSAPHHTYTVGAAVLRKDGMAVSSPCP